MPHLAPLNWLLIFLLANLQLFFTFILIWWTFSPSYQIPPIETKTPSFPLFISPSKQDFSVLN